MASPLAILMSQTASAQDTPSFTAEVKVVNLLATVRDRHGQLIQDLTKDDFQLAEDGHPQTIRYFAKQADLPLTVALMMDTSTSQEHVLPEERHAANDFERSSIRARQDEELIVTFDTDVLLWADLDLLDLPVGRKTRTVLYDAVYSISNQKLAPRQGRKLMIILSDGVDIGSKATLDDAVSAAIRGDVVIYSILFSDTAYYGRSNSRLYGGAVMKEMADVTGGSYLPVTKGHTVAEMFAQIAEDLHNQYSIGFISDRPAKKLEPRKLSLRSTRRDLVVQTRKWYFAQP